MALRGALESIKVVDFARYGTGPYPCQVLAEHGAEVIRIETLEHLDGCRSAPPLKDREIHYNRGGMFFLYNCNKYGVGLNLAHPRGVEVAKGLVARADIMVHGWPAGVARRLGLDYEAIRRVNSTIIYAATSLAGETGPYAGTTGFGGTFQGTVCVPTLTGWPDHPPQPVSVPYTDSFVQHVFGMVILAALDYRRRTGKGQYIEMSHYEAFPHALETALLEASANGRDQGRLGNRHPQAAPHGCYRCLGEEQWCVIAVFTDSQWQALVSTMGEPAWARDAKFATLQGRKRNEDELDLLIERWTRGQFAEDVMEALQAAGVPAGVVENGRDLYRDPQLWHRGHFVPVEHLEVERFHVEAPAFRLSRTSFQVRWAPPCFGQHNEYIMKGLLGMAEEEYVQLVQDGILQT